MQKFLALIAAGALIASASGALAAGAGTPAPAATPTAPSTSTSASAAQPKPMHHHMAMHTEHVKAIQTALNKSGEQISIDGRWGPKTSAALKDFQQKNGLKATGHADKTTLQKLNVSM